MSAEESTEKNADQNTNGVNEGSSSTRTQPARSRKVNVEIDGQKYTPEEIQEQLRALKEENDRLKATKSKAVAAMRKEAKLKPFQAELLKLQRHLETRNTRMIILFEGRDAAGKGGTIRRITRYMNGKHYRVVALGKPSDIQRTQWYYQKYVQHFPRGGEIVLFDRSWYNRAMVEPVFNFCTNEEYRNFLKGVTGFEKDIIRQGTILLKLYFSVTKDEQAKRFERRKNDSLRQWKLSEVDVQAQDHWDEFTHMKYEMLKNSHTTNSPWTIIRSNNKDLARMEAMKVILNSVDYENRDKELNFIPNPDIVVSGAREIELMEAQRIKRGKFSH